MSQPVTATKTILLHITDFHFGEKPPYDYAKGPLTFDRIAELVIECVQSFRPQSLIVAIGGDVPNKAEDYFYHDAKKFFNQLNDAFRTCKITYMICPGNHDLDEKAEAPFGAFNQFAFELTRNSAYLFSKDRSVVLVEQDGWSLVSVNTLYSEQRHKVMVNEDQLEAVLKSARHPVIILQHHHLIPMYLGDQSIVQNAYREIRLGLQYDLRLLLHGHIHSSCRLNVGIEKRSFEIVGCGALLPSLGADYLNQFNIFELGGDVHIAVHAFEIVIDASGGRPGVKPKII